MSACFDLEYCPSGRLVTGYDKNNNSIERMIDMVDNGIKIYPGDRLLIPTGLVFKLENHNTMLMNEAQRYSPYSIRIHARSGTSLKQGLVLANAEGVIDIDYQKEIFVLLTNISDVMQTVNKHERIAQAEVIRNEVVELFEYSEMPSKLSERDGGFGSTGNWWKTA
jgi:dUTP pyrophosphatase